MIPLPIQNRIKKKLSEKLSKKINLTNISVIQGGCINNAVKMETNEGPFFVKWNISSKVDMFKKEYKSLNLINSSNTISVPRLLTYDKDYLVLEFIETSLPNKDFYLFFGRILSEMHRCTDNKFGLKFNNYIGSLDQSNLQHDDWKSFFINERIKSQLYLGNYPSKILKSFDKLFNRLDDILPEEDPSLLHGDLWSGNFLVSNNNIPILIDPAVYYGSREMDIAMSKLFGGFSNDFYESYNECFPLEKGWEERINIYNLYPLLVHVNLFGGRYLSQVQSILSQYL